MNQAYKRYRNKLMDTKKNIDNEIERNGVSHKLLDFENDLENNYKGAINSAINTTDKEYISFNYFAPKTYILLAKDNKFEAIISFSNALQDFIKYINSIRRPDFNKWTLKPYSVISSHIENSGIELFGNTNPNTIQKILKSIKDILSIPSNWTNFKIDVDILLSDFLLSLVAKSSEIYTPEHLETAKQIEGISSFFVRNNNLIGGNLEALKFILSRKKLYYYTRNLVPKENKDRINKNNIDKNIKDVVENMKRIANNEINFFKKITSDMNESVSFKKFLAEVDKLSSEYYESLWIKKNLVDTLKKLENIFSTIRNNWQKVTTPSIFSHFVQEFVLLSNFFKLLLLARDFRKFREGLAEKEWQKEVSIKAEESLNKIASQLFKYGIPTSLERRLLIVEEASSGKFVEFIVYYLLREIIINRIELGNIKNISNQDIRYFLSIINKVEDISQIQWNYKKQGEDTDIDIFISGKYGIFLKTGILNSNDIKKIFNEIDSSKKLNLERVYQIIDIAKNLDTAKKLLKHPNITLLDVGEFLTVLLEIAYSDKKISLKISKSSILSWAGFYSGG
jgi:hypothetical protein